MSQVVQEPSVWDSERWPEDVRRIMSWLDAQPNVAAEKRKYPRIRYRVRAAIGLVGTINRESSIIPIYTRDAGTRSLGFIASAELPVGTEARLHLPKVDDRVWHVDCRVVRCSMCVTGWYEGAVVFIQEQPAFAATAAGNPSDETRNPIE